MTGVDGPAPRGGAFGNGSGGFGGGGFGGGPRDFGPPAEPNQQIMVRNVSKQTDVNAEI